MSQDPNKVDYEPTVRALVETMDEATVQSWQHSLQKRLEELAAFIEEHRRVSEYLVILNKLRPRSATQPPAAAALPAHGPDEPKPADADAPLDDVAANFKEKFPLLFNPMRGGWYQRETQYVPELGREISRYQSEMYLFIKGLGRKVSAEEVARLTSRHMPSIRSQLNRMVCLSGRMGTLPLTNL
jgi:hypothetical protein